MAKAPKQTPDTPGDGAPAEVVRLPVASVRATLRLLLNQAGAVVITRHEQVVGVLLPIKLKRWADDKETQAESCRALDRLRRALRTLAE